VASETFVTALLIITGIVAAGILISAVYPVVWTMAGSFTSSAHQTDIQIRTDFKIVSTYASETGTVKILMVNIGTVPIGISDIQKSIVNIGNTGNFGVARWVASLPSPADGYWTYTLYKTDSSPNQWSPGETIEIDTGSILIGEVPPATPSVYFQFILPSGVWRSAEFTISKP
jgi:flagellar protein FlaG